MKILSLILKIIETLIVCIWGVAVGVFFPVCIMAVGAEIVPEDVAARTDIMVIWLVTAAFFILAAAMIFMKYYRIAAVMSVVGLVGVLVVDSMFAELYRYTAESTGPDDLYLPLIFATLLDIFILVIEERAKFAKLFEAKKKKEDEKAPSILGDD
jgi:hypothetical protein